MYKRFESMCMANSCLEHCIVDAVVKNCHIHTLFPLQSINGDVGRSYPRL